mmetsp:Transcript_6950/g.23918  ORF Transcript_6950/g.23918 Transcript_6950/m.23918 type:complete len:230 (+) Transcript_6950:693-1382(+)
MTGSIRRKKYVFGNREALVSSLAVRSRLSRQSPSASFALPSDVLSARTASRSRPRYPPWLCALQNSKFCMSCTALEHIHSGARLWAAPPSPLRARARVAPSQSKTASKATDAQSLAYPSNSSPQTSISCRKDRERDNKVSRSWGAKSRHLGLEEEDDDDEEEEEAAVPWNFQSQSILLRSSNDERSWTKLGWLVFSSRSWWWWFLRRTLDVSAGPSVRSGLRSSTDAIV